MIEFHHVRPDRGPVQAVVLDWAGTTVDFGCCAPTAVFREVFRQRGVEVTVDEARGPMGLNKRDHLFAIATLPRIAAQWQAVFGRTPQAADVDQLYDSFLPLQLAAVRDYAEPVPGCLGTIAALRERGIKIGSDTGYDRAMMDVLTAAAGVHGYTADCVVTSCDVSQGRPAPWMALEAARRLDVYPLCSVVKVDDTVPGIREGLNAGMWTVGVAATGNEVGLDQQQFASLPETERGRRVARARQTLAAGGAHYVIDGIGELMSCIEDIDRRLAAGERP